MLNRFKVLYAPEGASGGDSDEPTLEQLQQQVADAKKELAALQSENSKFKSQVEAGELLPYEAAIEKAISTGEVFTKDRFVGMQKKVETEAEARKKVVEDLGMLKTQLTELETGKTAVVSDLEALKSEIEQKDTKLKELETKALRSQTIFSKYPELAAFEADGLLPQADDAEALEAKLQAFSDKLGIIQADAKKNFASGGGTQTPGSKSNKEGSSADLLKKAQDSAKAGKIEEYNAFYDKYLDALQAEGK